MSGINKFKENWIKKGITADIKDESEGAEHYRHLASEYTEMAEDEEGHKAKLEEMKAKKNASSEADGVDHPSDDMSKHTTNITQEISKPGPSIHSEKWDRCVADLKGKPGVNAYAVCTAQLGESSFKSIEEMSKAELDMAKSELEKAIGIAAAGPVPNSLLAEQDLEGETRKASLTAEVQERIYFEALALLRNGASVAVIAQFLSKKYGGSFYEVQQIVQACQYNNKSMNKGAVEQTGKKLQILTDEAENIEDSSEKSDLVERIKNTQIKRQEAILEERGSFKSMWSKIIHG